MEFQGWGMARGVTVLMLVIRLVIIRVLESTGTGGADWAASMWCSVVSCRLLVPLATAELFLFLAER